VAQPAVRKTKPAGLTISAVSPQKISLAVQRSGTYSLALYVMDGSLAGNIFSGYLAKGEHELTWNGGGFAQGVYIIRAGSAIGDIFEKSFVNR
jgi:hypothetical protein